jgi:chromosome segregation ATPase
MGRPPIYTDANARQKAYRDRVRAERDRLRAGATPTPEAPQSPRSASDAAEHREAIARLERELAGLREELAAKPTATADSDARVAALEKQLAWERSRAAALIKELEGLRKRREAKLAKPPAEPGSEAERVIKGLRTQIRNLKAQIARMTTDDDDYRFLRGGNATGAMSFTAYTKIARCLHSDHEPTAEEREAGMKALNQWKADQKAAAKVSVTK